MWELMKTVVERKKASRQSIEVLKFSWAPREGEKKEEYVVTVMDVERSPRPERFLIFVLKVKSRRGEEFIVRKRTQNFVFLWEEVMSYFPQWASAFCPPPGGIVPRSVSFLSVLTQDRKGDATTEDALEEWKRCRNFVVEFVRDYDEHHDDPIMELPGSLGDSIGLNLRVSFRCLFFLQRDPTLDKLDASGKWRMEQTIPLEATDGSKLFMRQFNPYNRKTLRPQPDSDPRAIIMIIHGLNDQGDSEPILTAAKHFTADKYLVYSVDVRGCGRSEGPRMVVRDFNNLVDDHCQLLDAIVKKHPDKKIFTLGISMGGGINVFLALRRKEIQGMLLIAPLVQVSPEQSPIMQKLSPIIAAIAPDSKIVSFDTTRMNHDPYHQRRHPYQAFAYVDKVVTCTGNQLLNMSQQATKRLNEVDTPFLVFHGKEDIATAMSGSILLLEKARSKDKAMEVIEGAYHDLLLEPASRDLMYMNMITWLKQRS